MTYTDRRDAGAQLAPLLAHLRPRHPVVLGLPRGGVPVAAEVARALVAPLDVVVVRKLGVPSQPELAMGAIGEEDARVLDDMTVQALGVTPTQIADVEAQAREELEARVTRLRAGRPALPLKARTVVVVDDGVATGATARAACQAVRARGAAWVVLAVPVGPARLGRAMAGAADEVVCAWTPTYFQAVGQAYDDFTQLTDAEVTEILAGATAP